MYERFEATGVGGRPGRDRHPFTLCQVPLTYMSTLLEHLQTGALVRFDPELGLGVLEQRRIYMLARVPDQIAMRIVGTTSDRHLEIAPDEQLDGLLADFCEGIEIAAGTQFKCLVPQQNCIWELKTPDVRMFGWFYEKDCFIATAVDAKWRIREHKSYRGYIVEAAHFRSQLFGEDAGFIKGMEPDDVLSNWC